METGLRVLADILEEPGITCSQESHGEWFIYYTTVASFVSDEISSF